MVPFVLLNFVRAARSLTGLALCFLLLGAVRLPAQTTWSSTDIGVVGVAGNSSESGNITTIRGAGTDIWGAADGFHFRSQTLTGDGLILGRVTDVGGGHAWAKIGLMMRENLNPGARNVMALLTPGGSLGFQIRSTTSGITSYTEHTRATVPVWLVLDRQGNEFRIHRSFDGDTWTTMGTVTLALPETIHVGVAVTSHNNTVLQTAALQDVMAIPDHMAPGAPPAPPADFRVFSPYPGAIQLEWWDGQTNESGFEIERAEDGGAFGVIATVSYNTRVYVDNPPQRGVLYHYRLRTVRDGVYSAYAGPLSARAEEAPLPNAWIGYDIGNTGSAGSDSGLPPTVTMNAGGTDIFGTVDSFRFFSHNLHGDGTVVARVASMTNTHSWAKAGVMFRTSLSADAANVALLLTPGNGGTLQTRAIAGGQTFHHAIPGITAPYWVRLTRVGNDFTAYVSPNGTDWVTVGTRQVQMSEEPYAGLAVASHAGAQIVASFDQVTAGSGDEPPPPTNTLTLRSLGTGTGTVENDSVITVRSASGDIYGTADSGMFYAKTWFGNAVFTTRVDQLTHTHDWAKAGLMFRANESADAPNVFVAFTPTQGVVLQSRSADGGSTITHAQLRSAGLGTWIRISRDSGAIRAYWSTDASTWIELGSLLDTLPGTVLVGLAVSAHTPGATASATFSGLGDM